MTDAAESPALSCLADAPPAARDVARGVARLFFRQIGRAHV